MRRGESERGGVVVLEINAARSGLTNSCRSAVTGGILSELTGYPRSIDVADVLGGSMPPSRDKRPLWSDSRGPFPARSWFSRADSAVHRGGGSGRPRS